MKIKEKINIYKKAMFFIQNKMFVCIKTKFILIKWL